MKPTVFRSFSSIQPRFAEEKPSEEITESDGAQVSSDHTEQSDIRAESSDASEVSSDQGAAAMSEPTDDSTPPAFTITIGTPDPDDREKARVKQNAQRLVFIGNLSYDVTFQELQDFVTPHGTITNLHLPQHDSGLNKGMAFVQYATAKEAQGAIEALKGASLDGRRLDPRLADAGTVIHRQRRKRETDVFEPSNSIFVGNLSYALTDKELSDIFRDVKDVIDVRVAIDRKTGNPRGFAHADFPDVEAAQAAIKKLNGIVLHGRTVFTTFAKGLNQSQ